MILKIFGSFYYYYINYTNDVLYTTYKMKYVHTF